MHNKNIRAHVLAGAGDNDVRKWAQTYANCAIEDHYTTADLVIFTGGSDVTPSLYGEQNVASNCDWLRDVREQEIFHYCRDHHIPMFGICRGSQFLHVMMGGKLWQDVDNHCDIHNVVDMDTGKLVRDTISTHHQMVRTAWTNGLSAKDNSFTLLAMPDASRSPMYLSDEGLHFNQTEVEAYAYCDAGVMGVQSHCEWSTEPFARWAADKMTDHVAAFNRRKAREVA